MLFNLMYKDIRPGYAMWSVDFGKGAEDCDIFALTVRVEGRKGVYNMIFGILFRPWTVVQWLSAPLTSDQQMKLIPHKTSKALIGITKPQVLKRHNKTSSP
jgi:hypothetical protein